ncbi:MAG: hypothetical protein ABIZ91_18650 [Gemmatimonadaceae bacterium]
MTRALNSRARMTRTRSTRAHMIGALSLATALAPLSRVDAQAICSAPHSSPTLAGGGRIGTLDPGTGWVMLSALYQSSTSSFNTAGARQPFLADGRFRSSSLYLSAGLGVVRGVDVWTQVPAHAMHYEDQGGARGRSGIGDLRVALRVSPAIVGGSLPLALRLGVKIPGSDFPIDATVIPLTEGQRDVEMSLESGHAFVESGVYLLGWSGYRWRGSNRAADRTPGNEFFAHAAMGRTFGSLRLELGADVLAGTAPRQLGLLVPSARRRMFQLAPTVSRATGPGYLEFTSVVPVVGRNLPSGLGFSSGYRVEWGRRAPSAPRAKGFERPSPS